MLAAGHLGLKLDRVNQESHRIVLLAPALIRRRISFLAIDVMDVLRPRTLHFVQNVSQRLLRQFPLLLLQIDHCQGASHLERLERSHALLTWSASRT